MHVANIRAKAMFDRAMANGGSLPNNPNRLRELQEWCIPKHVGVLAPEQFQGAADIAGTNSAVASFVEGGGDFSRHALRVSIAGAQSNAVVHIPIPVSRLATQSGMPRRVGGQVHYRIKCSDWSKVTRLWVGFTEAPDGLSRWDAQLVENSRSAYGCKDPIYDSAWSGKWRTLPRTSADFTKVGTPAAWGDQARYYTPYGVRFRADTTGDVSFDIDRIYSVEWPVAVITTILDGSIRKAVQLYFAEFGSRGWGFGGSYGGNRTGGDNFTPAEYKILTASGYDVFWHTAQVLPDGYRNGMEPTNTELDFAAAYSHARAVMLDRFGAPQKSLMFEQFLQNKGQYNGSDMAGIMRKFGVVMCRRMCSDAQWGASEWNFPTWYSQEMRPGSVPYGGFYNMYATTAYIGQAQNANFEDPYIGETVNYTFAQRFDYACNVGAGMMYYQHDIEENPPYPHSVTPEWFYGYLAEADMQYKAGKAVFVNTSDLILLTLKRPGPVFQRWDGEWVYSDDPTRIAF